MEYILKKSVEKPFLYSKNNIVTEIDNHLINLTGYSNSELIGKSLTEISCMLKIDSQIDLEDIEDEYNCFIFTKEYEPIEVTISCEHLKRNNENIYFIKVNKNSSVKERFDFVNQLYIDSKTLCSIISVPHLILLKANENYLNFLDEHYNKMENNIGKKYKEIIPGYECSESEEILNSVITTGEPYYVEEFECDYFNRGVTYWNSSIIPIFIEGNLKYIINKMLDVTEKVLNRKLLHERVETIKEQKVQLEAIIENISDQLVFIKKNGDYTLINKISKQNHLYDIATLKNNQPAFEQAEYFDMDGDLISYENLPVQRVIRGEKISRYILITKIKNVTTYTAVTGTPTYDTTGNFIGGVMSYRDMTEKIKTQENAFLKTQYKALEILIENLDLGCAIASYPDLNIKYMNNKYCNRVNKINPELMSSSIIGKNIFDIFKYNMHEKSKIEISLQNSIEKKSDSYFYYKKYVDKGEEKFLKIMCQPMLGLNNKVIEVVLIEIDITEEIKANIKMEETLKIQDEMFSNISHELKTPLNVIFSANQLMQFHIKNNSFEVNKETVSRSINIIKQNCYRFTKIINNIIDISKIESGFFKLNLSNENIVSIIEETVQSVAEYIKIKELNVVFDTNIEEKIIACDPDKIERIILNIISNAVKFTDKNGSIFVNIIDRGETVEILVKDTGIGMEKKYLDNIFKRFHQVDKSLSRNAEGSGIGLSLVKSLVELHGGQISAQSNLDEGSLFKIEIPARIIENTKVIEKSNSINSKIEMIKIEFADIYSIS